MLSKALPTIGNYAHTNYRISTRLHREINEKLISTRQRNLLLGAICRDVSCLIFKSLEAMQLGVIIKSLMSQLDHQSIAIVFVEDADFFANGVKVIENMRTIIKLCIQLCEAASGKMQEEKIMFYA